ncbi:MAG: hypothetical protein N2506_01275 [Dehalococcoidales bacterium]|nr:hypothetical protein [Dehalococcoidales bacterium]
MWRRGKRFIIIAAILTIVIGATIGGVAIAQANDDTSSQISAEKPTFLERVAQIYEKNTGTAIDADELQKAIDEARQAMKDEALDRYLDTLIEQGKITEEQAEAYKNWLKAKPAFPTDEFREWWESRPDIPGLCPNKIGPFGGMRGEGMPRGFKSPRHFGDERPGNQSGFGGW